MQFLKNFSNTISYRYAELLRFIFSCRFGCFYTLNAFELSLFANNIFNTEYTETNLVPTKGNLLFGVQYNFR
jgi:iron complex outermembrane receptor protein